MDGPALKLAKEHLLKNYVDHDMYPQILRMERQCIKWLHRLWNGPQGVEIFGAATVGSSEACMLGGLALKRSWKNRALKNGKNVGDQRPNLVMGAAVQVVWKKFCNFFEVEPRYAPLSPDSFALGPDGLDGLVDANTIGVVALAGQTLTGEDDDIVGIHEWLDRFEERSGCYVPMHIDGASGGFVNPFVHQFVEWDFRLPRVLSINASGHKFGLVPPGLGWVVWRSRDCFPEELAFYVNYLGGEELTATLNFSRNSFQVAYQYYNFIRLGFNGYRDIMTTAMKNAARLRENLVSSGLFRSLGEHIRIPVVSVALLNSDRYTVFDISERVRLRGWIISAYTMPPKAEEVACLRVVVRPHLNSSVITELSDAILEACEHLQKVGGTAQAPELHDHHVTSQKC